MVSLKELKRQKLKGNESKYYQWSQEAGLEYQ